MNQYRYLALLRGININGKNVINMKALKHALEALGFTNVGTYINSGNVIFDSAIKEKDILIKTIEEQIQHEFSLDIPVAILTKEEVLSVVQEFPLVLNNQDGIYHQIIFMIPPTKTNEVYHTIGTSTLEGEHIYQADSVIYWSIDLNVYRKSKWAKIASSSMNRKVTIRTANTIKKIADKM